MSAHRTGQQPGCGQPGNQPATTTAWQAVLRDIYGDNFGQHGWSTADEVEALAVASGLEANMLVVDVAAGSGGFLRRFCGQRPGVHGIGIDLQVNDYLAYRDTLDDNKPIHYCVADALHVPFRDSAFDIATCIDAMPVIGEPVLLLSELARVVRPGGRVLIVDPAVITGPVAISELLSRGGPDNYLFVPQSSYGPLFGKAGLALMAWFDLTASMDRICLRWHEQLTQRRDDLGDVESIDHQIRFCEMLHDSIRSGGLSRHAYIAARPATT